MLKYLNFKKIIIFFTAVLFVPFLKVNAANQEDFEEGFYNIGSCLNKNMFLDVNEGSSSSGANVQLWEKNNTLAQIFCFKKDDKGYYTIFPVCSGMALDAEYGSNKPGTNVWQYSPNSTDAQKWSLEHCYDDVYKIKSKVGGGYLDAAYGKSENGTNVWIWSGNNTSAQKFKLQKIDMEKHALYGKVDYFGEVPFEMNYAKKLLKLKNHIYKYYLSKNFKNVLIVGNKEFLKNFDEVFNSQNKFKYDLRESLPSIKECDKYDHIINEKYNGKFLRLMFSNEKLEIFQEQYPAILCQATIDFLKENKIPIYFFEAVNDGKMKNAKTIRNNTFSDGVDELKLCKQRDILNKIFGNNEECKNFFTSGEFNKSLDIIKIKNHFTIADFRGKYCNIIDHHRFLKNAPENSKNNIYMYGACTMRSRTVADNYTIEYFIQEHLNKDFADRYRCVGYGLEAPTINDFEYILDTKFKPGDIVVVGRDFSNRLKQMIKQNNCPYALLSVPFDNPNIGTFSVGSNFTHFNHKGCKIAADYIYNCIKDKVAEFSKCNFKNKSIVFEQIEDEDQFIKDNPDFTEYLEKLKTISKPYREKNKKIGSLNVNCNPFTKGHRYLIEEALKRVDHLFLFVVEEDASEFSFKDRYEMVKRGIEDLDNITLLTTGKWMCSKFTFPDYFDKDALQSKIILNPTKDIELYGKYIASALGATLRFAGEEPLDLITRQHNNFMKEKLPDYGVEFCEIPRKTLEDGQVISASKVRKYLKDKNFKELQKLVPKTTYDYLLENFV